MTTLLVGEMCRCIFHGYGRSILTKAQLIALWWGALCIAACGKVETSHVHPSSSGGNAGIAGGNADTGPEITPAVAGADAGARCTDGVTLRGVATRLVFDSTISRGYSRVPLEPTLRVRVLDCANEPAQDTEITLSLANNTTAAELLGTTVRASQAGVAEFTDINVSRAGSGYTLIAKAAGSVAVESSPFDIVAWRAIGPYGGVVESIEIDPLQPTTLYALTSSLFRSTDAGANWEQDLSERASSVALSAKTPGEVYAGVAKGVLKRSGARNWVKSKGLPEARFTALLLDERETTSLYAASAAGIYRSVDSANSWEKLNSDLADKIRVTKLVARPDAPNTLFALTEGQGLFTSVDGGVKWRAINEGLPEQAWTFSLAIDPADNQRMYVTAGHYLRPGLYRSTNSGEKWESVALPDTDDDAATPYPLSVAISPADEGTLYIGTTLDFIWRWPGHGHKQTVATLGHTDTRIGAISIVPGNPNVLYAATRGRGVVMSNNGGGLWETRNAGLLDETIGSVELDGGKPRGLHAASPLGNLHHYDRTLKKWRATSVAERGKGRWMDKIAFAPSQPTTAYGTSANTQEIGETSQYLSFYRSSDAGTNWSAVPCNIDAPLSLAVHPKDPKTVYVTGWAEEPAIYRSDNAGDTWTPIHLGISDEDGWLFVKAITFAPSQPSTLYVAVVVDGQGHVYRSVDAGAHWQRTQHLPKGGVGALVVDPKREGVLIVVVGNHIYRSEDAGDTWLDITRKLSDGWKEEDELDAAEFDPSDSTTIWVAGRRGIFRSRQGGAWEELNSGLFDRLTLDLVINPDDPNNVYSANFQNGLFETWSGGE
jgi:photosystem II stability/assembly factor-like uncharacterized protein